MNAKTLERYKAHRKAGHSPSSFQIYPKRRLELDFDYEGTARWMDEHYRYVFKVVNDDAPDLSWLGKGTDKDRPFPQVLRRRAARRNEYKFFEPGHPVLDARDGYVRLGFSHANAYARAVQDAQEDMARFEDYGNGWHSVGYVLTAYGLRDEDERCELGEASVWGYESDMPKDQVADCIVDLLFQVKDDVRRRIHKYQGQLNFGEANGPG